MQQPAPSQPSPTVSSFAGLLATLASPPPSPVIDADDDAPLWDSSALGEDVATLSYERALRKNARYRPMDHDLDRDLDLGDGSLTRGADPASGARADAPGKFGAAGAIDVSGAFDAAGTAVAVGAAPGLQTGTARESDLRSASVTIRLSQVESARLHQRAAEAGLTVSAYLRSCAVEAEGLRAQVKQALAELKAGSKPSQQAQTACTPAARPRQAAKAQGNKKSALRMLFGWIRSLTRRGR
jgi:hypothetical protein